MARVSHVHEPPPRALIDAEAIEHQRQGEIIVVDRDGVRAVDRAAIDEYGIPGIVLMENAARGLTERAMRMLDDTAAGGDEKGTLIVCGSGNNGGDGYALARHLHNRGVPITIAAIGQHRPESNAGINREICRRMRLREHEMGDVMRESNGRAFSLIVDAIFGTGLDREVTGAAAQAIEWMNAAGRPTLAVDVPSGMDCNTGRAIPPSQVCVKASVTVTFVGLKPGFLGLDAQKLLGEVVVADIGVPRELLERYGKRIALPRRPEAPEH